MKLYSDLYLDNYATWRNIPQLARMAVGIVLLNDNVSYDIKPRILLALHI